MKATVHSTATEGQAQLTGFPAQGRKLDRKETAMMRAIWRGVVIAETPRTKRVEGNDYFPPESLKREYFTDSPTKSLCMWKGMARYYTLTVNGETNPNAAWYYRRPLARSIKNHVAFWNGVIVEGAREKK